MATVFSDDFNRADSATLGGSWVDREGDMQVKNNQMFASGISFSTDGITIGLNDYSVACDHTYDGTQSNWVELISRSASGSFDNCYFGYVQNETGNQDFAQLYKRVATAQTQLGSTYNYTATATETRTWALLASGSALTLTENGVSRIATTDSAFSGEAHHGVRMGPSFYCDNYVLSNFVTAVTPSKTVLLGGGFF